MSKHGIDVKGIYIIAGIIISAGVGAGFYFYPQSETDVPAEMNENIMYLTSALRQDSTIEEKAPKADAIIIGEVQDVSDLFTRPDPNEPEFIEFPFRDATILIHEVIAGQESIDRYATEDKKLNVRTLSSSFTLPAFEQGETYLVMLRNPCDDNCIFGPDTFIIVGAEDGRFLLKDGKASNIKEGEMAESELIQRIQEARTN